MDSHDSLRLSALPKTWILDLDGTLVKHNGYKTEQGDVLLPGAREFLNQLGEDDLVVIITSRPEEHRGQTETFLREQGIRFDYIIWGAPCGERILLNDSKPSGLKTAYAVNCTRDHFEGLECFIDETL